MTTYSFSGYIVENGDDDDAPARSLSRSTLSITTPDSAPIFRYVREVSGGVPDDGIRITSTFHSLRIGATTYTPEQALELDAETEQISWPGGVANILILELDDDRSFIMQLSGTPLPDLANVTQYNNLVASLTQIRPLDFGNFGPDRDIALARVLNGAMSENDLIYGTWRSESLAAGPGNDLVYGGDGNDTINGGDGTDTLDGGAGDDFLYGGSSAADLRDVIYGGDGNDHIDGGYGNDALNGGAGNDTILGGFGADTLVGNQGSDRISGGAGADEIHGGPGDDWINGGFGHDRLNGGAGADIFYHEGVADHGSDWIQDYRGADGDVLSIAIAGATRGQFQINYNLTPGAGMATVAEAFVIYRPTGQILFALVDGDAQDSILLQAGGQRWDLLA